MNDDETPFTQIETKYRVRGGKDQLAGRKSKYDALVAAGDPYAEHYRAGYNTLDEIYAEMEAAAEQRKNARPAETEPSASPGPY